MQTHIGIGVGRIIEEKFLNAKDIIFVSSPTISPTIAKKLIELTEKGIKIKMITSEPYHKEDKEAIKILQERNQKNMIELKVVDYNQAALIHAKIFIIDERFVITGSANLTEKSFFKLPEYIIIQNKKEEIKKIKNDFDDMWNFYQNESLKNIAKKRIKKLIRKL